MLGLGNRGQHGKDALFAFRLQVHARDQVFAAQNREAEAAPSPLFRGQEDFEPVLEAEEALGALAEPHDWVKRREQVQALVDSGWSSVDGLPAWPVRRFLPTFHPDGFQLAGCHQFRDAGLGCTGGHAEIVGEVGGGGHTAGAGGNQ